MPLNYHVNLPGPVSYTRPVRKKRKGSGPLTTLMVWFIVKPLELIARGTAAAFRATRKPEVRPSAPVATRGYFAPPVSQPGWYDTAWGPLYWNGRNWYAQDGRAIF